MKLNDRDCGSGIGFPLTATDREAHQHLKEIRLATYPRTPRTVSVGRRLCTVCQQEAEEQPHTVADCLAALEGIVARLKIELTKQLSTTTEATASHGSPPEN